MHRRRHIAVLVALVVVAALSVSPPVPAGGAELTGTSPSGEPYAVAFVAGSSAPPSGDRVLHRRLVNAGFAVTTIDDDVATPANLGDVDIVVVSSSVVPAKVAWLAGVDIPLLTWEGKALDDLGLASKSGETSQSWTAVQLGAAAGPLAGGFTGKPAVYAGPAPMSWGTPSPEAVVAGTETGGQRRAVYFGYYAGATLANGDEAAARRVAFFPTYESVVQLNATGLKLFDAAVAWVLSDVVPVQILGFNDFHGNLEPPMGSSGRVVLDDGTTIEAGGAANFAAHLAALEAENPNTAIVSAGDLIGASPLISAIFHDEPTIETANLFGLDFNAVGNHEFDEGTDELLRMQEGGPHPVDADADGVPFEGAHFEFLAANVQERTSGATLFPSYEIMDLAGVDVAFIGETLEGTPAIVSPSGIADYEFLDEADTVNALIPEIEAAGADIIVLLVHEGGAQVSASPPNGCSGISGPIVDIVDRLDPAVDMVISGHTHMAYNCEIDGRPVTSSLSFGRLITDYDIEFDLSTGGITGVEVDNVPVTRLATGDPEVAALVAEYKRLSEPIANEEIGNITADLLRAQNAAGESALGDVIADAQLAATAPAGLGDAVVAFMNPGGIRTDLLYAPDGVVTFGEAFAVQPFGNNLVTITLTGAQIDALLEQQWTAARTAVLQVSEGFTYEWSGLQPPGSKVDPDSIRLNGVAVDPVASYRVTVNSFLADGGDGFTVLPLGTARLGGVVDTDAFEDYLDLVDPVSPPELGRIVQVP